MRKTPLLALLLSTMLGMNACKSKEPAAEDPQKRIEQAFDEHMDENKDLYDKDLEEPKED
jgi:hypothetical protein